MSLNITPLRLSVLRLLASNGRYNCKSLVQVLMPRGTASNPRRTWTEQGAARMAGKLTKPLEDAGLIKTDYWARMYNKDAWITAAGLKVLEEHDAAAGRAELAAAIESGE